MKFRTRDAAAAFLAVVLAKIAWTDDAGGTESMTATVNLAFYDSFKSKAPDPSSAADSGPATARWRGSDVSVAGPAPFDVDGDGTVEAAVVPRMVQSDPKRVKGGGDGGGDGDGDPPEWVLRVIDLKPMHGPRTAEAELAAFPFRPDAMFESKPPSAEAGAGGDGKKGGKKDSPSRGAVPVAISTGQIVLRPHLPPAPEDHKQNFVESNDRTRHYFCGKDWHDAANRCGRPCPSGSATDCPDGESCYADTPCDSMASPTPPPTPPSERNSTGLVETPAGTLPSVVTAWSDGSVTLHAVTKDRDGASDSAKRRKRGKAGEADPDLELRLLWRTNPFVTNGEDTAHEKMMAGLQMGGLSHMAKPKFSGLEVSLETDAPIGTHGAVIVAGRFGFLGMPGGKRPTYHAIDAFTGRKIWSHTGRHAHGSREAEADIIAKMKAKFGGGAEKGEKKREEKREELTDAKRMTGFARRRSRLRDMLGAKGAEEGEGEFGEEVDDVSASEDCMVRYRHWIMDPASGILPHLNWDGEGGSKLTVAHFDRRHEHRGKHRRASAAAVKKGLDGAGKKSWQKKLFSGPRKKESHGGKKMHGKSKRKLGPVYARPNVVVFHDRHGLSVLSLKNGRAVCQLSLLEDSLYDDLNGDGTMEQIQVLTRARPGMGTPGVGAPAIPGTDTPAEREARQKESGKLANSLVQRIFQENRQAQEEKGKEGIVGFNNLARRAGLNQICHALVLSGLPAREEVFSARLCDNTLPRGGGPGPGGQNIISGIASAAPPLIVESLDGLRARDVVFAMGSGSVTRHTSKGALQWTAGKGAVGSVIPTWTRDPMGSTPAYLGRIDFEAATRTGAQVMRPILVSGVDGLSVLSAGRGRVLASAKFPQSAVAQPVLADLSGDGTTDVMILSADGLWGYKVTIKPGGSKFLRIAVGLLLVSIGVAALWNKLSNPPGADRRSTDA